MIRAGAAALATAAAILVPAPAFGQSAGDDQYRDPFAGQGEQQEEETRPGSPAPAPAAPAAPTTTTAPAQATAAESTATVAGTLPRTGLETALIAAAGVALTAAGAGLRRSGPA